MNSSPASSSKPLLRERRDWQSLLYLVLLPALALAQWHWGFSLPLYLLMLFLAVGVGVVHHNHAHLPIWRWTPLNRATDLWITLVQGHPTCVFQPTHVANHHRYNHGLQDAARTYRFGGDHNHFVGWMLHPLQAAVALYPLIFRALARLRRRRPAAFRWCLAQYALWIILWAALLWLDAGKAMLLVILPQLFGLHWLLGANYLQHAHADGHSKSNFARNFGGWVNPLWFNIGLHTAHHHRPRLHWSKLPQEHASIKARVDPRLCENDLLIYLWRSMVLGAVSSRYRSHSLMAEPSAMPGKIETSTEST